MCSWSVKNGKGILENNRSFNTRQIWKHLFGNIAIVRGDACIVQLVEMRQGIVNWIKRRQEEG